jgi:pyrophosphate--fructose-6-phosphate 1-phosphotransferase
MLMNLSPLARKRLAYKPSYPGLLKDLKTVCFKRCQKTHQPLDSLRSIFPNTFDTPAFHLERGAGKDRKIKIGVLFSGGQAPGGHNVIAGMFDSGAEIIGFLGGPLGLIENQSREILDVGLYRNQGGFDLIGSGRTKIETPLQLTACLNTCMKHKLDGLVIIGGDDSNTNAAILAEFFLTKGCPTCVIGVPKTIDGDLRSEEIEISFGFDSACKTYSEMIGNIARDALSSKKYYHFIKLMGRSASHITLECALSTQPNLALISEERKPLSEIVGGIADLICRRSEAGKEYGIILIPEGLIEFVPELNQVVKDLNLETDPHGNVQVSQIQTEKLLIELSKQELKKRGFKGKFAAQDHFFGYEGRACLPTNFDANYCYALGLLASVAVREGLTGLICAIQNLKKPPQEWKMKMIPIIHLMNFELRSGQQKPVIKKTLVDIKGKFFAYFSSLRKSWEIEDRYQCPGPIQFFGDPELTDSVPLSL